MTDPARPVRPERALEHYSRGSELVRAIRALWTANEALPAGQAAVKAARIEALRVEFDLTFPEWYYWSHHVQSLGPRQSPTGNHGR